MVKEQGSDSEAKRSECAIQGCVSGARLDPEHGGVLVPSREPAPVYNDETRLRMLYGLVRELETSNLNNSALITRDQIPDIALSRVLSYPMRWLLNQFRSEFTFSADEMSCVSLVFRAFIKMTGHVTQPDPKDLVQLRMDLHVAEGIIEKKLTGLSSLEEARDIEHFCQNDYRVYFSLEEVLRDSGSFGLAAEHILH
jgi:hypothetical protein